MIPSLRDDQRTSRHSHLAMRERKTREGCQRDEERVSSIEQTRHTIDPLFKPFKARLSRYRVSVFPCLLYLYISLSLSLSPLHPSIKIERWDREREREIEERGDDGQGDLDDWG